MIDLNKLGNSDLESYELILSEINNQNLKLSEEFGDYNEAIGYNETSGNVWALLDTGLVIYSAFGQEVGYMVIDNETGEEFEYITEAEALDKLNEL